MKLMISFIRSMTEIHDGSAECAEKYGLVITWLQEQYEVGFRRLQML